MGVNIISGVTDSKKCKTSSPLSTQEVCGGDNIVV